MLRLASILGESCYIWSGICSLIINWNSWKQRNALLISCCWQLKISYAKVDVFLVSLSVWLWAVNTGICCFFFQEPLFWCISQEQLGATVNIESSCAFHLQLKFLKPVLPQMGKLKAWRREPETHHIPKASYTSFWCESIYYLTFWVT